MSMLTKIRHGSGGSRASGGLRPAGEAATPRMPLRAWHVWKTLVWLLAAVALAVPSALALPGMPAWAQGGSVAIGVSVESSQAPLPGGSRGSVDISVSVGHDASGVPSAAPGSVPIGVSVGYLLNQSVTFVGHYCTEDGAVDASRAPEVIMGSPVEYGHSPVAPDDALLRRTYDLGDGTTLDYWVDGWYLEDPSQSASAAAGSLADITMQGDPVIIHFLWKKGYAIKLDANNGTDDDAAAAFGGTVAGASFVSVPRQVDDPDGFTSGAFPKATRPGYEFAGWYWADEASGTDKYGRAILADAEGDPVVAPDNAGMPWRFFEEHAGRVLYAKWNVAAPVRIELADARDADMNYGIDLWFWPGRGYALSQPAPDLELTPEVIVTGEQVLDLSAVAHNPVPAASSEAFGGWGYANAIKTDSGFKDDTLIACTKIEDASGKGGRYEYRLTARAFVDAYVNMDGWTWQDVDHTATGADGMLTTTWDALFEPVQIRVRAPFEVTFEKADVDGGYDPDTNPDAVLPYAMDELEWSTDDPQWISSLEQRFANLSKRSVYISGIECVNVGASAILPGGANGQKLFSLSEAAGAFEPGDANKTAIMFGYAQAGSSNVATVNPYDDETWIVLPVLASAGTAADASGGGSGAGATYSKRLWYGLDLKNAAFDRAAIAVGDDSGASSYVAKLANVKYTYSVVP